MTISSSMNAGVMGLAANATKLATISDNIANSSTYGYKRSEADFHSMVVGNASGGYSAGGVRTTTQRLIGESGSLITTGNATDLAVRGRGMLPVTSETAVRAGNGELPLMLQTTGSFRPDADGYLKSESGHILMGWPAMADGTIPSFARDSAAGLQPIKTSINQFAGEPTTRLSLAANLPAESTEPGSSGRNEALSVEYYDNMGTSESLEFSFVPTLPASPADPATNAWTMRISDSAQAGAVVGEYRLAFSDTRADGGKLASVATVSGGAFDANTGILSVNAASGPIEIDIGRPNQLGGFTQLSSTFSPLSVSKNGAPVGNLIDVEVDGGGFVHARYDSGMTRRIFQVPLADVPNPNGLEALDAQTYAVSNRSGSFFLWDAGDGPTGDVVGYAREESTTDVAQELTDLIQTQRAYSSNAKVIQTVDEMLQETTNIKR